MKSRSIIFVPGKNPKPPAEEHRALLWRTLVEGVRRAEPALVEEFSQHADSFQLLAWNPLYYDTVADISRNLPWVDALINQHGATEQDILEAQSWHVKWDRLMYSVVDHLPFLLRLLPGPAQSTAEEINRYFCNEDDIGCEIRELLKQQLRPKLADGQKIMLIGHSLGSVIAYDTLWELSHLEKLSGKVDLFLTIGSPLGMHYVQRRLQGYDKTKQRRYPANIRRWVNISSVGDLTALDRTFGDDFSKMRSLGMVESIEDHCEGIYNFFHNEEGLNCHRSYGYLVNPAVGKVIADWWC